MTGSTPIPAAVAVLFRASTAGLEVFWARRAPGLAFLGGFWAFPGGKTKVGEGWAEAAARELEEETGLALDPAGFVPCGRTITPPWAHLRYDAAYFLVEVPAVVEPDVSRSGGELVAGEWTSAARAIELWGRSERLVSPVVLGVLDELAGGLESAAARIAARLARDDRERSWQIAPGFTVCPVRSPTLPPATHTNCYVVGGAELVVIDPASPYPDEQAELDRVLEALGPRRVREILLTHHHRDHVSGARHLHERLGVPIAAHAVTASLLAGSLPVGRTLADGDVTVLPGSPGPERRLRAVFTPGHAPGHLCFHEEQTGYLITGDMVAGVGTILIDPSEGDMADYLASLARMKALAPRALLPAHGPVLAEPAAKLDEYVRHRLWREERVRSALATQPGATPAELVPSVYDDVAAAVHGLAERSLRAHLVKLVKEGRAQKDGDRFRLFEG